MGVREVQEKVQLVGIVATETLIRVCWGCECMTVSETTKLLLDHIVNIKTALRHLNTRLTDLEFRVTENGG